MKERLALLGFAMALEPVPNLRNFDLDELDDDGGMHGLRNADPGASLRKTASSHTAGRSAHTSGDVPTGPSSPFTRRPLKRQRLDSPLPNNMQLDPPTSRDAMPPPPKPLSKMRSVRKIFPSLKKRFAGGRSTPAPEGQYGDDDVYMYDEARWDNRTYSSAQDQNMPSQHDYRSESPYMSGALPVERPAQASVSRGSQLLSSVGIDTDRPDFTFRASSPVKPNKGSSGHQPVQLPTEPSYIRLMDGLSYDSEMELGLRDPRTNASISGQAMAPNRQVRAHCKERHIRLSSDGQDGRQLGYTSLQESLNEPSGAANSFLDRAYCNRTDGFHSRTLDDPRLNPITPAPRRHHQPGHQLENVVSPFVERNPSSTSQISDFRIAEPQDSSNHSAAYRSQRPRMTETRPDRREPLSVNGLSFFESPVISRQRPVQHDQERYQVDHPLPSRQYQGRNLNSRGYVTRPDAHRSPFFRDSAYGSSRDRPTYSRRQHMPATTAIPFPSFNRTSYTRTGQLASNMPSITLSRSPTRTQPQWEALQRMGVRSSRNEFGNSTSNGVVDPQRSNLPSTVRRSIRR